MHIVVKVYVWNVHVVCGNGSCHKLVDQSYNCIGCTAVSFSYHRDCTIINFDVLDIDKFQALYL